jgi:hypothetical protein
MTDLSVSTVRDMPCQQCIGSGSVELRIGGIYERRRCPACNGLGHRISVSEAPANVRRSLSIVDDWLAESRRASPDEWPDYAVLRQRARRNAAGKALLWAAATVAVLSLWYYPERPHMPTSADWRHLVELVDGGMGR